MRESKEKHPCEAETHVNDCPCLTCVTRDCTHCNLVNKDHFTSKSIAKLLHWKPQRLNDPANIQILSILCHRAKDLHNPQITEQVKSQINGGIISFGEAVT